MKIGVRAHDFSRMSEIELPKVIKNAGFDSVQLAITKAIVGIDRFSDITDRLLDRIKNEFEKNELEINVLGCYIEPADLNKDARLANVETFKNSIEFAKKLGVKIVGTETTNFDRNNESKREESYLLLKDSVLRMVEKAEKENIFVGIEPVAEHTLNTPQLTRRLLDEVNSDKLKIIFDPVNMLWYDQIQLQQQIFSDCFSLFGEEIVVVHAKDIVSKNNEKVWTNIGSGSVDYKFIFEWLNNNKKDISILREGVAMDSYTQDLLALKGFCK